MANKEAIWIECSLCKQWDIYENYGLTGKYSASKIAKQEVTCRNCMMGKLIEDLIKEVRDLKDKINLLEIEKEREERSGIAIAKEDLQPALTAIQLKQAVDETSESDRRKLNLIVVGLQESNSDLNEFINLANQTMQEQQMDGELSRNDFEVECTERMGKSMQPGKPRLLKIKLKKPNIRRMILTMRIKTDAKERDNNIYIRPDLTKSQQELDKKLRADLLIAGKDRYKIKRGKIVPRDTTNDVTTENAVESNIEAIISSQEIYKMETHDIWDEQIEQSSHTNNQNAQCDENRQGTGESGHDAHKQKMYDDNRVAQMEQASQNKQNALREKNSQNTLETSHIQTDRAYQLLKIDETSKEVNDGERENETVSKQHVLGKKTEKREDTNDIDDKKVENTSNEQNIDDKVNATVAGMEKGTNEKNKKLCHVIITPSKKMDPGETKKIPTNKGRSQMCMNNTLGSTSTTRYANQGRNVTTRNMNKQL